MINADYVNAKIDQEMAKVREAKLIELVSSLHVNPYMEMRPWDYAQSNHEFPCWIVLKHEKSNTAIAYCEQGFGPLKPWGLLSIVGPYMGMGMDTAWFSTLEEAVRDSMFWDE